MFLHIMCILWNFVLKNSFNFKKFNPKLTVKFLYLNIMYLYLLKDVHVYMSDNDDFNVLRKQNSAEVIYFCRTLIFS